jgi:hypothetical protein
MDGDEGEFLYGLPDQEEEPEEAVVAMTCPHCEKVAMLDVMGRADWDGIDTSNRDVIAAWTKYRFLQCQKCGQVCVDSRSDHGDGFAAEAQVAYPAARELSKDVPDAVRGEWDEAQVCFRGGAYKSCAGAVRRTVEAACAESGVKESSLDRSLKVMLDKEIIDPTLYEWATMLRFVGNDGAHHGKPVRPEDVKDALSFTEALVDHIYVLRKQFATFQARRAVRNVD